MSDLEKQASTWVPPWQRPAATPSSEDPADDSKHGLREAAEEAAARWSAAPSSDDPDTPDDEAAGRPGDETASRQGDQATGRPDRDAAGAPGGKTADRPDGDAADRPDGDAAGRPGGQAAGAGAFEGAPSRKGAGAEAADTDLNTDLAGAGEPLDDVDDGDEAVADGKPASSTGAEVPMPRSGEAPGGAAPGGGAVPGGVAPGGVAPGGDEGFHDEAAGGPSGGAAAMQGAAAGKKARTKKERAADGSLKDGLAVAEMLAKTLPEQRSKPRKSEDEADLDDEVEEVEEPEEYREYEPGEFKAALEAILMVVDEPVSELVLATVLEVRAEDVANALIDLSASYTQEGRGFDLRRAAGGWRYYTRADYAPFVERFVLDGQQLRLTQASLETLAVVAYKQPVTRARISAIRGVNVDGVIRTLITRGMVEECGTDPDSGGHLYKTTTLFLEKMGLDSVEQLPPLAPFLPDNLEELANGE